MIQDLTPYFSARLDPIFFRKESSYLGNKFVDEIYMAKLLK